MNIDEEIQFVRANIDALDKKAIGYVPKTYTLKRSEWDCFKEGEYKKAILKALETWDGLSEDARMKYLNGIGGYAIQALEDSFWQDNLYNIYGKVVKLPDDGINKAEAHRQAMRDLRNKEAQMDPLDANLHCWKCGLWMHKYDKKNNKRHEDGEICQCASSRKLQARMTRERTAYRKELERQKKLREAKKK